VKGQTTREIIVLTAHEGPGRLQEMTITLKPEQERIIQQEIQSGHFRSPDEVLDHALAALQGKKRKGKAAAPRKNLAEFLMESPLAGAELNLKRQKDYGRAIEL
jgi:Arc/MetJ-type ribon-helix-helix transcriptional regulator